MDVIAYVNQMIECAVRKEASDIHIEPIRDSVRIRHRIDGYLIEVDQLSRQEEPALLSRLKVMGNLDIGERRKPQDGAMSIEAHGQQLEIRFSTIPTLHGEKMVLRLLYQKEKYLGLSDLGMTEKQTKQMSRLMQQSGLIVVTGPTGSGKTTSLYALLHQLNTPDVNIVTLEDPIELQIPGVNQVQVGSKFGLSFAQGLRAILRQDPNIIMIGEIRDSETAENAIGAALTGHLVLTTLHTQDSASAITRLLDMGIAPYLVAAACKGVLTQRLVRTYCSYCQGSGCDSCHLTGYQGRIGVFEILEIEETIRQLILERASVDKVRSTYHQLGISTLVDRLFQLVDQKITSLEEVYRVLPYEPKKEISYSLDR
ncbi:GspE/PulE family protein [Risungbinella massiliensis]|uniref:GspE/PulE family protein n=1 Tax=Risungbinella massiliensis TaxID=1329796 RepID=UPI000699800C|nr:GspE/PulE family protein [Risungbinella massiliensis]